MRPKIKKLVVKKDERGWLAEIVRAEEVGRKSFGQMYVTTAHSGKIKGGHYHKRKTEWFCVIAGNGVLTLVNRNTGYKKEIKMGERNIVTVLIPPNYTHSIKNTGRKDMFLLAYVDEPFNPKDPDTYYEQ